MDLDPVSIVSTIWMGLDPVSIISTASTIWMALDLVLIVSTIWMGLAEEPTDKPVGDSFGRICGEAVAEQAGTSKHSG